ncbi:hypothetical protein PUNSTDRAFT_110963 [Punctularia strigosozonata HHB-11173 SS5]|uniref:uncharacterized protein n=1 Tax=Punctularia strigosozonata (strain HHB-11173) TaxID=741275 RepID=UPI0004417EBE|nr:uncharacterized protein PUNSTDRAFT_110963 [Punctularia strigosozonata HHB-11173 SS5]EIN12495.1 hypothetical protein PUNSTDRAFT_110963 [Punctularia strigosozonata HHB-11173 SS5]
MEKRPRTAHGNTTNPPHSVEENPSVAHDGAAMAPIATQRVPVKENLALGVVERFLAGLDPPMHQGHLPILFRKLGVSGVKFDAMCRLADEERTEFLDRHLQPFISAIDLHILKCGFRKQAAHQCAGARDE